jgi:hypothetical protein
MNGTNTNITTNLHPVDSDAHLSENEEDFDCFDEGENAAAGPSTVLTKSKTTGAADLSDRMRRNIQQCNHTFENRRVMYETNSLTPATRRQSIRRNLATDLFIEDESTRARKELRLAFRRRTAALKDAERETITNISEEDLRKMNTVIDNEEDSYNKAIDDRGRTARIHEEFHPYRVVPNIVGSGWNPYPMTSDLLCMNCSHKFTNIPVPLPRYYTDQSHTFLLAPYRFCSFACSHRFALEDHNSHLETNTLRALHSLYGFLCRTPVKTLTEVPLAPPRAALNVFGGPLGIEEYRRASSDTSLTWSVMREPYRWVLEHLSFAQYPSHRAAVAARAARARDLATRKHSLRSKKIGVNVDGRSLRVQENRWKKAPEVFRVQRTKAKKPPRNQLAAFLNKS